MEQRHIFEHAQRRDERKILEDHADAKRAAIAWRGNRDALAVHQDVAGIGRVVAVQDFGERAFAGAVLAEERNDLAGAHTELGDIVGEQRAEPLDDAARFEEGRPAIDGGHGRVGSALRCIRRTSRQSASLLCARPSRPADTITTAIPVRPGAKRDDKALTVHMERVSAAWFASPAMARPIRKVGQVSCRAAAQQGGSGGPR